MKNDVPKTQCHTPTPGKKPTNIPSWKYDLIRNVLLRVVPKQEPGITNKELIALIMQDLSSDQLDQLGSVPWHLTTVRLNMEVDGEISRVPGSRPQRLVRT